MIPPETRRHAVLVTDAYWRKAVAAVRSLGRAGAVVDTADPRRVAPAGFSRYCRHRLRSPALQQSPEAFLDWTARTLDRGDYSLILPCEEDTCLTLSRGRRLLPEPVWLPTPPAQDLETAADKLTASRRAASVGIPTPETLAFAPGDRPPPPGNWVLKPRQGTGARGLRRVIGGTELGTLARSLEERFGRLVLQALVPGRRNGYGVSLLYDRVGCCRAGFVHRKVRELPASGGVSTCAESVRWPELVTLARQYVEGGPRLSWQGLVNLEFKVDARTGTPCLIEVNPRLWGAVPLAVRAGVDFPALLWEISRGGEPRPRFEYATGVRMRWAVYGELAHAWERIRAGEVPWDVLGEEASGDFLWDSTDPAPFWASLAAWGLSLASPAGRAWLRR